MHDILNHKYYDVNNFKSNFNRNECIMLSINVCSLMSKFENLSAFVLQMVKNRIDIKVIAVQETWNIPCPELLDLLTVTYNLYRVLL